MSFRKLVCSIFLALMVAGPLSAGRPDSEYIPAKLVFLQHKRTTVYTTVDSTNVPMYASKTKTYAFVVKVGDTLYIGEAEKDTSLSGRLAAGISGVGNFNEKDWAKLDTNDVLVRFEKKGLGWNYIAMTVKQPNGKANTMRLQGIRGPDGKEQCGKRTGCTGHNWDKVPQPTAAAAATPAQ
jgi:hypothetical protein